MEYENISCFEPFPWVKGRPVGRHVFLSFCRLRNGLFACNGPHTDAQVLANMMESVLVRAWVRI